MMMEEEKSKKLGLECLKKKQKALFIFSLPSCLRLLFKFLFKCSFIVTYFDFSLIYIYRSGCVSFFNFLLPYFSTVSLLLYYTALSASSLRGSTLLIPSRFFGLILFYSFLFFSFFLLLILICYSWCLEMCLSDLVLLCHEDGIF